jgi:hypothetical protein
VATALAQQFMTEDDGVVILVTLDHGKPNVPFVIAVRVTDTSTDAGLVVLDDGLNPAEADLVRREALDFRKAAKADLDRALQAFAKKRAQQ